MPTTRCRSSPTPASSRSTRSSSPKKTRSWRFEVEMPNDEKSIRARLLAHGIDLSRLPRHVAIIMDGNGRWAQGRGLERLSGHRRGKDSVKAIVQLSRDIGLEYLSLYAFSSENWERPASEVNGLMSLLKRYLTTELDRM